jgi:hypothetical protein
LNIAKCYRMDGRGMGVQFLVEASDFFLMHNVQTGSGAHPSDMCREIKRPGHDANHSPISSNKAKNERHFTAPYTFMAWVLYYSITGTTLPLPIEFVIYSTHSSNKGILCPKSNDVVLILLVSWFAINTFSDIKDHFHEKCLFWRVSRSLYLFQYWRLWLNCE